MMLAPMIFTIYNFLVTKGNSFLTNPDNIIIININNIIPQYYNLVFLQNPLVMSGVKTQRLIHWTTGLHDAWAEEINLNILKIFFDK